MERVPFTPCCSHHCRHFRIDRYKRVSCASNIDNFNHAFALCNAFGLFGREFDLVGRRQSKVAQGAMLVFIGPLIAKLAVSSGQSIGVIFQVGPALLLQELGNLGTVLFALPIALLLGFKRETIGMTSSICREPNLGVVIDKYGFDSPEARGVLAIFVIGTMIGTIYISFLAWQAESEVRV